jgi:predicted nucleic acid-binding protein
MNVLVDTTIWLLAFRRSNKQQSPHLVHELEELIREARVEIIGPIRQEILSGISEKHDFYELRKAIRSFPDLTLESSDFERAAEIHDACRTTNIQGSNRDFLLCAVAESRKLALFTTDKDFHRYVNHCTLHFHSPRSGSEVN